MATHRIAVGEMPSHNHGASSNWTGEHNHDIRSGKKSGGRNEYGFYNFSHSNYQSNYSGTYSEYSLFKNGDSNNASVWMVNSGGHSHVITINNNGSSQAHNNMMPYLIVYMWRRTV